ncbi:MAG: glycosyltransferase, partial [Eubacteriales bacterium]
DQFAYNEKKREELRNQLLIQDKFVIGHVGRFSPVKNHKYLLEILEACMEQMKQKEVILLLVGDGPLREEIMEQAIAKGLSSHVIFVGNQREVWDYYQAMDFFLLPSFYEGLPGTAIEAQCSGLPCILSDTITREAGVTDLLIYKDIRDNATEWADYIIDNKITKCESIKSYIEINATIDAECARRSYVKEVEAVGFNVKLQAKEMMQLYTKKTKW